MMKCPHSHQISSYKDGALSPSEHAQFLQHVSGCSECSQELEQLQRIASFLKAAPWPEYSPRPFIIKAQFNQRELIRFAEALMAASVLIIALSAVWNRKSPSRIDAN